MAGFLALLPLFLLLAFVGGFAWLGYQMYIYTNDLADRGQRSMAKRNISFTKEGGMKVGVKEMNQEEYSSKTQNAIVSTWNNASLPAYKSRIWNQDAPINRGSSSGTSTPK